MADKETELTPIVQSKSTSSGLQRARRRWVTVEPVVSLSVVGYISIGLLRPFYLKTRLGESLFNMTKQEEFSKCHANNSNGGLMEDEIQSQASMWLLYLSVAMNVPIVVTSIMLVTLSDRLGRKLSMVIPILGYMCQEVVYILSICYKLPLPVLLVGEFLQGLGGGYMTLFAGSISYISEITFEKNRTIRIAVVEMLMFFMGGLVQIGVGYMLSTLGPIWPLAVALGLNVLALIYIAIPGLLIETVDRQSIPEDRKGLKEAGRSVLQVLKFNENGRRWQMLLLDLFIFFVLLNVNGVMSIFVLYGTAEPFCWTAIIAGLAGAFGFITGSIGMVAGTKLFSFCLGEYWIMQISCFSLCLTNVVMSISKTTALVFIGDSNPEFDFQIPVFPRTANALGALRGMGVPIARSVLSTIVDPSEIGAAFSIVACVDSMSSFASNLLIPSIYAGTVSYLPPIIFFVLSGLAIIPSGIILILQIHWPRRGDYKALEDSGVYDDSPRKVDLKEPSSTYASIPTAEQNDSTKL